MFAVQAEGSLVRTVEGLAQGPATGDELASLPGHATQVNAAVFSPERRSRRIWSMGRRTRAWMPVRYARPRSSRNLSSSFINR